MSLRSVKEIYGYTIQTSDGEETGVAARRPLRHQRRDGPAHRLALHEDAFRLTVDFGDVVAELIEVVDGVADDHAVPPEAGACDKPSGVSQGDELRVGFFEIREHRSAVWSEAVGQEQDRAVPIGRGQGDGESGGPDLTCDRWGSGKIPPGAEQRAPDEDRRSKAPRMRLAG